MQRNPVFVTKKLAGPGCRAENRFRFKHYEVLVEHPLVVQYDRQKEGEAVRERGHPWQANDDYWSELAPLGIYGCGI